jgi:hypothetical protein
MSTGTQQSLTFSIVSPQIQPATGFISVNISGFINPQYIGNSSSFIIVLKTLSCSLSGCTVSNLTSGLFGSSNTAGDLPVLSMYPDSTIINTIANLYINLQLYAPIPVGGNLTILLPQGITPVMPVTCINVKGYILTNSNGPTCTYNSTSNTLSTVNFAYPYLASTSAAVIAIQIYNPADTANYKFGFQSIDQSGRIIGLSKTGAVYSCDPGTLNYTIIRNDSTVDANLRLSISVTFSDSI